MKKILSLILIAVMLVSVIPMYCAAVNTYTVGDIVQFGSYPQTKVEDESVIDALNSAAPEWESWTSYDYYSGTGDYGSMSKGDWMRYTDVTYDGNKYRGVKFTQFRPRYTYGDSSANEQSANGYEVDTVYWFAFEPLSWRVLDPNVGFIVCDTIIDSQAYSNTIYAKNDIHYNDESFTEFTSDYATSSLRVWLNADFYTTAFTKEEQEAIADSAIENSGYYTSIGTPGHEELDSIITTDKVFLLSYKDAINTKYGFSQNVFGRDDSCKLTGTDYTLSQGLAVLREVGSDGEGYSSWILRSPGVNSHRNCGVYSDGSISGAYYTYDTNYGIRPAVKLFNISKVTEHDHYYKSAVTTPATHISEGENTFTCRCCGDVYTEVISKIEEHSYESHSTLPTCTSQGCRTFICICGDNYITNYVSAVDHKDSDGDYKCDYDCGYEFPQPEPDTSEEGKVKAFFTQIGDWIKNLVKQILEWVGII